MGKFRYTGLMTLLTAAVLTQAADAPPTVTFRALSAPLSQKIAAAAVAECTKRGYKVAAAVVGRDGNLLAFARDPLAGPHTILVSQRKAYSSASLQAATSQMGERPDLSFAPGMLLIQGGVPISIGGRFYGGAAVAGADPKEDEVCALAGVAAVTDALEFADD